MAVLGGKEKFFLRDHLREKLDKKGVSRGRR